MDEVKSGNSFSPITKSSGAGSSSHLVIRPLPLREYSESQTEGRIGQSSPDGHRRRKSTHTLHYLNDLPLRQDALDQTHQAISSVESEQGASVDAKRHASLVVPPNHGDTKDMLPVEQPASNLTPPVTPMSKSSAIVESDQADMLLYDFSKIDYEIDRAKRLGEGLWSKVYIAHPRSPSAAPALNNGLTPPSTPNVGPRASPCSMYAVKVAHSPRVKKIYHQEAKILTRLQRSDDAQQFIVPFYGLDERDKIPRLLFEGVEASASGRSPSLEGIVNGFTTMTESERQPEMRIVFIKAANDLIDGLRFIHAADIIHADVKPANVLLDIHHVGGPLGTPMLRARYIDFSASFASNEPASNAGGTWDYMAPEQISSDKNQNKPSFASDVWSLGITLLFIILGRSPYAARCGTESSKVMWRVKNGTPLQDAQIEELAMQRTKACQDFVDCCNKALQKNRDNRLSAAMWSEWFENTFPKA